MQTSERIIAPIIVAAVANFVFFPPLSFNLDDLIDIYKGGRAMHEENDGVAVKLFPFLVGLTLLVVLAWRVRIQQAAIYRIQHRLVSEDAE